MKYKDAGVDIQVADDFVGDIKEISKDSQKAGVIGGIGQFAALFELPLHKYKKPVLVSSTDGVGTKLKLAVKLEKYSGIGIDLVAMCANDVAVMGAEPLFFLDYYATSKLDTVQAKAVIESISKGCKMANMALIGGETAEMPNLYHNKDFDLAGFCVGCIDKDKIIDINAVSDGDILIGVNSSGVHSNGFSLVNHLINLGKIDLNSKVDDLNLADTLLKPTMVYVDVLSKLFQDNLLVASAHITGGGIVDNLPRILPDYTMANIDSKSWDIPSIFKLIQNAGSIDDREMYKVFNCGIGLVLVVKKDIINSVIDTVSTFGYQSWVLGKVTNSIEKKPTVCFI